VQSCPKISANSSFARDAGLELLSACTVRTRCSCRGSAASEILDQFLCSKAWSSSCGHCLASLELNMLPRLQKYVAGIQAVRHALLVINKSQAILGILHAASHPAVIMNGQKDRARTCRRSCANPCRRARTIPAFGADIRWRSTASAPGSPAAGSAAVLSGHSACANQRQRQKQGHASKTSRPLKLRPRTIPLQSHIHGVPLSVRGNRSFSPFIPPLTDGPSSTLSALIS